MKTVLIFLLLLSNVSLFSQEKTFNITRNTIFFSEQGEELSFDDFALITSKYKNTLLPTFDDNNSLKYIIIRYPSEAEPYVGKNRITINTKPEVITPIEKYTNNFHTNSISSDSYSNVKDLPGMLAPHFSMLDENNNEANIENLKGKVVVLKFWFSKCIPCIEEMPALNKLVSKYSQKNIVFYAPSVEKKSLTENFLKSNVFNYTTILEAQDLAALYKTPGYPTHVIIGKYGRVRKVIVGKRTNIFKIIDKEIEIALMMQVDDVNILELEDNESFVLNEHTIIVDAKGEKISKEEYIYRLKTGRYKIFKKLKKNGNTHLLITLNN